MKKTIWYISKYAVTPEYGNPTRQFFLSKFLARKGYNVSLISSKSSGISNISIKKFLKERDIDGIKHILLNGPEINLGFSIKRIFSWLIFETILFFSPLFFKHKKPDIIIVSSLSLLTILTGYLFKKIYGAKLIFEVRDIWPLSLVELKNLSNKNPFVFLLSKIEKFGYRKSDYIIGTMPKLDLHLKGILKNDFLFKCIPMGFDPEFYKKSDKLIEEHTNKIPVGKFICGYAGSLGTANSVETIIGAAEKLNNKNPHIHFVILGDGNLKKEFINRTKKLKNITFLPKVSKTKVIDFLIKCDVLLNPWQDKKIYQYGVSPNKWIDYMYSGKPIIVSYNGYPSIINEAKCGEFIPANNPIKLAEKIIEFSEKTEKELIEIGKRGKNFLEENLSYDKLANQYVEIFNSFD